MADFRELPFVHKGSTESFGLWSVGFILLYALIGGLWVLYGKWTTKGVILVSVMVSVFGVVLGWGFQTYFRWKVSRDMVSLYYPYRILGKRQVEIPLSEITLVHFESGKHDTNFRSNRYLLEIRYHAEEKILLPVFYKNLETVASFFKVEGLKVVIW